MKFIYCQKCGGGVRPKDASCGWCGAAMPKSTPEPKRSGGGFIYCQNCGGGVRPRDASCGWCGAAMPKSTRSGGGFKWVAIGCGGLIGLFALIVIIAAIASGSSSDSRSSGRSAVARGPSPTPVPPFAELVDSALRVTYDDLFRYNERYVGESVYYRGQVNQVVEQGFEIYLIQVYLTEGVYGGLTDDIFVVYKRGDGVRVLEDDIIEFVGRVTGLFQYKTVMGAQRTVPELQAIRLRVQNAGLESGEAATVESDDVLACKWSVACAESGLEHGLWTRVFQECAPNDDCRLHASTAADISEDLDGLLSVESRQSEDGSTAYRAMSNDGQRSVAWMDKDGLVFVEMTVTVPYDVYDITNEYLLRTIASELISGTWDFDVAAVITSFWFLPPSDWARGPDAEITYSDAVREVNGVAMRVYYVPRLSKAGVVFEVSP